MSHLFRTDASIYEIIPLTVNSPKTIYDLAQTVKTVISKNQPITLRAGGTSLGGQAIGSGVIVDVSQHLTHILGFSPERKEVMVEPGVIQDDLNDVVKAHNLRFAPDTSTSNRAMIGGMIGNNSCGSYSVYYGTTREHVKSVEVILADGSETEFKELSSAELHAKLQLQNLEGEIYRTVIEILEQHGQAILDNFPHPSIKRRNTGYALDELYRHHQPFNPDGKPFNLTPLICGSEGTLAIIKTATLNLVALPKHRQLLCAHFNSVRAALECVPDYLAFKPAAVELIDKATLDGTLNNREQQQNRFWIEGDPQAVLVIELFDEEAENLQKRLKNDQAWLKNRGAYAVSMIAPQDSNKVWEIRKAGLGLLMGKPTRQKAVAVIEDAAVPVASLPDYYEDVQALMAELQVGCVYYGHASVGLIHIRPELDLVTPEGKQLFQTIAERNSKLVKKYRGAISGEHGDGRIRAPFIKEQVGEEVYGCLVKLKQTFDPHNLLNPGVIIGDMPITQNLRADRQPKQLLSPKLDWSADLSLIDAVEKCNGAGACRKSAGRGTMCPSYQATREEAYSTRGRSNLLRYALTEPNPLEALSSDELQDALELCLSCKACASECPASVDMASLKAEVLYQTRKTRKQSSAQKLSQLAIQHYGSLMKLGSILPLAYNKLQSLTLVKRAMGVDERRQLPKIQPQTLQSWWQAQIPKPNAEPVLVLVDLYTQYQEPEVGKALFSCLQALGFNPVPIFMATSPRALISQGLLDEAFNALTQIQSQLQQHPNLTQVIGIEPSELLVWHDEAAKLLKNELPPKDFLLFEEWLLHMQQQGQLNTEKLKPLLQKVWVHTHCHQKSLAKQSDVIAALKLIPDIQLQTINSGCCGMAGDFGYKHYDVSLKIANQALLPAVKAAQADDLIVATGTSCRHQIADLSAREGLHVAQIFDLATRDAT
ncbi:FAD-binding and (Fe-S)-binding domain-containing protein [Thiosulfativibrio zosterae]|uniref:Oxidoreductase n=1 Tax=Thiosulfativibrio zosterae TaxID=2675053 RepID=A0A6F8PPJ4_9GAMM|nr:FAD-binding and (Fe-S)-binding domain-containing protein [Thiosulfativibrio zosterae]BBP44025.1 oxidoreductase [Thiosulfativibrio zosterae]